MICCNNNNTDLIHSHYASIIAVIAARGSPGLSDRYVRPFMVANAP